MANFSFLRLFLVMTLCFLSGCYQVRTADFLDSLETPDTAYPAPIKFSNLRVQMPVGSEIGILEAGCLMSFQKTGPDILTAAIDQTSVDDAFAQTLQMQGYDVVNRLTADFPEEYEDDILRAEYKISAKIIDADIHACRSSSQVFLNSVVVGSRGVNGELYLKIQWAVYDHLRRKVVYKTQTEGYTDRKTFNIDGLTLMMNEAFSMAAHNLGADPQFRDLIFYGIKPEKDWAAQKQDDQRPRLYDPQEAVVIQNLPVSMQPIAEHIDATKQVAVLISQGTGHGSGYFITQKGHILTNAHVVGDARRVRVETAENKKKLVAEVLRTDKVRDVALLRLEEMPDDLNIVTMPIRTQWPQVSEDIYALGAPQYRKLRDTLSKGIVSAHREKIKVSGVRMDFIQGDVPVHGGNSGGPLFDAQGNIVGMCVSGYSFNEHQANESLNFFIPIGDALEKLNIVLE